MKLRHSLRPAAPLAAAALLAAGLLPGCATEQAELAEPAFTKSAEPESESPDATEEETTTAAPAAATSAANRAPDCSNKALEGKGWEPFEFFEGCYGNFARIGAPNSDWISEIYWNGSDWEPLEPDGTDPDGAMSTECHTRENLEKMGAPEEFIKKVVCPSPSSTPAPSSGAITSVGLGEAHEDASYPACDGRNILILESVVNYGNREETQFQIAQQVLMQHPSSLPVRFTVPGQCPSLRAQIDGNDIYPIYLDFGSDVNSMCVAKSKYGGNGRVLYNRSEFVDPC